MYVCVCNICIPNWPLPIGAFQDQCKQIVINKHIKVKNPNWREADQLAIYKRRREVELGATKNNISQRSERDLNPQPTDFKSDPLTTRPHCLHLMESNAERYIIYQDVKQLYITLTVGLANCFTWYQLGTKFPFVIYRVCT